MAKASKGKRGGREVPLCGDLQDALGELQAFIPKRGPENRVIFSERGVGISRPAIAIWFGRLYAELGFKGASSHSGGPSSRSAAGRSFDPEHPTVAYRRVE